MVSDSEPDMGPDPLVGGGAQWTEFLRGLERAAGSEATVLLTGEHGVGKGWLAKRLHGMSPRAAGPIVELDLSVGSPTLIESLLFGHEEGAFTGAQSARLGAVRRAEGGTLVLQGLQDLELTLQVKLLRLIQERVVEPLGSEGVVPVDVRVVATAQGNLLEQVHRGTFREDLYYRVAVVVLAVPPLRVRFHQSADWLPDLCRVAAARVAREPRPIGAEALALLKAHPWPGNVLELENALERVLVLGGPDGGAGEIGPGEFDFLQGGGGRREELLALARQALALGVRAEEWNGALLAEALEEYRGKYSGAARAVGLTRKAFDYRLQRFLELDSEAPEATPGEAESQAAAADKKPTGDGPKGGQKTKKTKGDSA